MGVAFVVGVCGGGHRDGGGAGGDVDFCEHDDDLMYFAA